MSEYKQYVRTNIAEMADWHNDFDMNNVSISAADIENGSPLIGDKIARNPENHNDKWLVAEEYYKQNFAPLEFKSRIEIKGNKVEQIEVEEAIKEVTYTKIGEKIVVAHVTLVDGFEVIGKAGVVDPSKFDMKIGSKYALEDAMSRIWEHMGSILQDRLAK